MNELVVAPAEANYRLDQFLRLRLNLGLRAARRLCDAGAVLLNARPAPASLKLRAGQVLCIGEVVAAPSLTVTLLQTEEHFAFFFKPATLHSASLAASPGAEEQVKQRFLGAKLLNRLDCATSGILAAALDDEGMRLWGSAQNSGRTVKHYLALAQGCMLEETLVTNRLLLKNHQRVLAELAPHADPRRHTKVVPHGYYTLDDNAQPVPCALEEATLTLVGCTILKGARHQIRAHLALLGHPLWGDVKYGGNAVEGADEERFYLHHDILELPEARVLCPPPWEWYEAQGQHTMPVNQS